MDLPAVVHTNGKGFRHVINTVQEALKFIDEELPFELKEKFRWTFARELLAVADTSRKKRDVLYAFRQLKQALNKDRLSNETDEPVVT